MMMRMWKGIAGRRKRECKDEKGLKGKQQTCRVEGERVGWGLSERRPPEERHWFSSAQTGKRREIGKDSCRCKEIPKH